MRYGWVWVGLVWFDLESRSLFTFFFAFYFLFFLMIFFWPSFAELLNCVLRY